MYVYILRGYFWFAILFVPGGWVKQFHSWRASVGPRPHIVAVAVVLPIIASGRPKMEEPPSPKMRCNIQWWLNHGKTTRKWWFNGIWWDIPSGKLPVCYWTLLFSVDLPIQNCAFHIVVLVYQRANRLSMAVVVLNPSDQTNMSSGPMKGPCCQAFN